MPYSSTNRPLTRWSRRRFLKAGGASIGLSSAWLRAAAVTAPSPIIDIHQHTNFMARADHDLIAHQKRLGIAKTILLPAGRINGLAAGASGCEHTFRLVAEHPEMFASFANDVVTLPGAIKAIESYLKKGGIGIGELKDNVDCDSPEMRSVADLAREYRVPMLIHFEEGMYNSGFARFAKMVEQYPDVTFIGHAQTWWANVDANYRTGMGPYPKTKPVPGGFTDRWLADYPNLYVDLSAGSGIGALMRDPGFGREFVARHQEKLLFGTDCYCRSEGLPRACRGDLLLQAFDQVIGTPEIRRKLTFANAQRLFRFRDLPRRKKFGTDWLAAVAHEQVRAAVGVAIADRPAGPYSFLYSMCPGGSDSRDFAALSHSGQAWLYH